MIRLILYTAVSTVGAVTVYETHGLALAVTAWVGLFIACLIVDTIVVGSINGGMWG